MGHTGSIAGTAARGNDAFPQTLYSRPMPAKPHIGVIIPVELRDQLFHDRDLRRLEELGEVTYTTAEKKGGVDLDEAVRVLGDAQIALGSWGTPHPGKEGLIERCPELKLWLHVAGSVKTMFTQETDRRGLTIASCKGAIADNVAEMVLGEIILGVRRFHDNARKNRSGKTSPDGRMKVVNECTVGVVGASQVGRRVIKLLRPLDPTILLYDPILSDDAARELGAQRVEDLTELCRRSDVVTLHTPALPATKGMMGREQFRAMGDREGGAIFINTSRGECVDEAALIEELQKGEGGREGAREGGLTAYLDVTSPEPAAEDSPLRSLENVMLTSHIAGPAGKNMGTQAVRDVEAFIEGRPPDCVVTREMLAYVA